MITRNIIDIRRSYLAIHKMNVDHVKIIIIIVNTVTVSARFLVPAFRPIINNNRLSNIVYCRIEMKPFET